MSVFKRLSFAGISGKLKMNPTSNTDNSGQQTRNGLGDSEFWKPKPLYGEACMKM